MSEVFAISRIAKYKYSDCGGVLKEALRTLPNYDNPDCKPELSHLNYTIVPFNSKKTPEKYIVDYRSENDIKGRFNLSYQNPKNSTNIMCQALFSASHDFLEDMTRDEIIVFYMRCFDFFKLEFPDVPILSAVIHFDETTPHMHLTFLPIAEKLNKKTNEKEKLFSTTLLFPGKDYFPKYQDRFFDFMSSEYDGLSRKNKEGITRDNLSVKEYKKFQAHIEPYKEIIAKQKEEINRLLEYKSQLEKKYKRLRWIEKLPFIRDFVSIFTCKNKDDQIKAIDDLIIKLEDMQVDISLNKDIPKQDIKILDDMIKNVELSREKKSIIHSIFSR